MEAKSKKITAKKELRKIFMEELKPHLPERWIDIYINKFHFNNRGMAVVQVDRNLQNINKGKASPTFIQIENIRKLITITSLTKC